MSDHVGHVPVLVETCLRALDPRPGETYCDCTAGLGGHALEFGRRVGPRGRVVLNDLDGVNLRDAAARLRRELGEACPEVVTFAGNFAHVPRKMAGAGLRADMVLADLGFASNQVQDAARGLSFSREGPLDMRLARPAAEGEGEPLPPSAAELLASMDERELARVIREYGEERHAGAIARKLAAARREHPISTTTELARLVRSAVGRGDPGGIDPATRTFQALRIAVNDELGNLDALLHGLRTGMLSPERPAWLAAGARAAVISFHSLEDRPVKAMFARLERDGLAEDVLGGPTTADEAEVSANPRSRSAKLRAVRRR